MDSASKNVVATPLQDIVYKVTATDSEGCSAEDSIIIKVIQYNNIYIPTAFTPNNDGKNEVFKIVYDRDLLDISMFRIYNRYGEMIFETRNAEIGWDGTFNNTPANTGVYVYYFELDCYSGETNFIKGNVTLLR